MEEKSQFDVNSLLVAFVALLIVLGLALFFNFVAQIYSKTHP